MSMRNSVIHFLNESYLKYPDKNACADEEKTITYRQLWEQSHIIAGNLVFRIEALMPVPVMMRKSCNMLQIVWGIIKAGGCYTVIDPFLPMERIESILKTLNAEWIIGEEETSNKIPECVHLLRSEELYTIPEKSACEQVTLRIDQLCDIDPVYIMFTSGSTGVPKGIVANHRSLMDFIHNFTEIFEIDETEVIGNQAPWDFDVSVKDIFSAAKAGALLQIIPRKYFSFPIQLADFINEKKVSILIWAVSALCILSSNDVLTHKRPKWLKKIIFSGEVMPVKQYNIWRKSYPHALFANVYGPTEITCNCTYQILNRIYEEEEAIPIGKAFPNEKVFLLEENDRLIKKEICRQSPMGEICVSGTAVTMGYYNNFVSTQKSFLQNPLNQKYTEIIYRTGDLGYYNVNGELCFATRKDLQIKHLGHRIELVEIERVVSNIEKVKLCCCIYHTKEIYMFYEGQTLVKEITSTLRKKLPSHMLPSKIIKLDVMPINKNGKVDRKKLNDDLEC